MPHAIIKCLQAGFTLIELMIVVAIIGILAMVAMPSYLNHANKAKFSEVILATAPYKIAIETCLHQSGTLAACGSTTGSNGLLTDFTAINGTIGYVATVSIGAEGVITATSQQIGDNYTFTLTPTLHTNGQLTWQKGGTCLAAGLC